MNIEVIAEHSVDIDLLPAEAIIADLGCRGFLFTDEMRRRGFTVIAVDVDKFDRVDYHQLAVSFKAGRVGIKRTSDPQATCITEGDEVDCVDLPILLRRSKVEMFDLIKMDVEGSEYDIIMALTKPPARQLSIEFHLHTGIYGEIEIISMENKLLSLGYFPIQHDKTRQHGLSYNYWDSLWVLK